MVQCVQQLVFCFTQCHRQFRLAYSVLIESVYKTKAVCQYCFVYFVRIVCCIPCSVSQSFSLIKRESCSEMITRTANIVIVFLHQR